MNILTANPLVRHIGTKNDSHLCTSNIYFKNTFMLPYNNSSYIQSGAMLAFLGGEQKPLFFSSSAHTFFLSGAVPESDLS